MGIAEAVFLQVQALPEDKAKEVLDFAKFLAQQSNVHAGKRQSELLKNQVKIVDTDWYKPNSDIEDDFYS